MECKHANVSVVMILVICNDCGENISYPIDNSFNMAVLQVRQGRVDADTMLSVSDFTDEQNMVIRNIISCKHDNIEVYECDCSHVTRKRCLNCNRIW